MIAFALRGMLGRKLRTTLTALAIVLGVAMISGTYILTDSIDKAFDGIFTRVYEGTDASITGKSAFDLSDESGATAPPFAESLLPVIEGLGSVEAAIGGVAGQATLVDAKGKAIVFGGAPNLGFSVDPDRPEFNALTLEEGAWPGADEVVIDITTASKKELVVGGTVGVQAEGPVNRLRISGLVRFGGASSIGGATLAGFDLPTAQRLFNKVGQLDQIRVKARAGVDVDALTASIEDVLPTGTQVKSSREQAADDAADTNEFITFLRGFLLAFAGIALFVGSFVIANSLAITIAQRTREFATMRTLGASRRQVMWSVLLESFVVGLLSSITGVILGLGLAKGLFKLFDAVGFTLPNSGILFQPRTAVVGLIAGTLVTVAASVRPARRATRVPPIAAVREGATLPPGRFHRFRTAWAVFLLAIGFAALLFSLFGSGLETTQVLTFMGIGALLIFLGTAMVSERLIRPLVAFLGTPSRKIGGMAGGLAQDNARRNPQRTASTASALMIGLALVTLVATLAAGITTTFRGAVDDLWKTSDSDYAITAQNDFSPIATAAADAVVGSGGVTAVMNVRAGEVSAFGKVDFATAVDPDAKTLIMLEWVEGSQDVFANLGPDGVLVDDGYAESNFLQIGSAVPITFPDGTSKEFTVRGIFNPPSGGSPFGPLTISVEAWDSLVDSPRNLYSFIAIEGDVNEANTARLEAVLKGFPNAKVQSREEFIDNQIAGLSSVLNILYILLALSVIVSLFGIINTLVLSVFERTREIGMLRAIGMTRRQVRRMIRHESVITALIGALVGIVLGVILAALMIWRVDFIDFAFPVVQVVVFALAAVIVGIVAAIFPARRAAKLDPLEALQYE